MNLIYEWGLCIEITFIASRDENFSFIEDLHMHIFLEKVFLKSKPTVSLFMVKIVRDDTIFSRDWFALKNVGMGFLENEISSWISRLAHFIWLMLHSFWATSQILWSPFNGVKFSNQSDMALFHKFFVFSWKATLVKVHITRL